VQGLLTWPEMQKSLVPVLFLRPKLANHSAPRRRMVGATATWQRERERDRAECVCV
jgi:hypothetical protein